MERQLAAVCATFTGLVTMPMLGVAQIPTLAKWGAYLEQRVVVLTNPLLQEFQTLLGPVTYETLLRDKAF